jgi:hypothetical protein
VLMARTRFFKESQTNLTLWVTSLSKNHFPTSSCNSESRDEILHKGGRLWRPRFLTGVINANNRISRVKSADTGRTQVNLGHQRMSSGTFAAFSKFLLNTSKSTNTNVI